MLALLAAVSATWTWPRRSPGRTPRSGAHVAGRRRTRQSGGVAVRRRPPQGDRPLTSCGERAAPPSCRGPELAVAGEPDASRGDGVTVTDDASAPTGDEHLRLVLLCCHPALDVDTQIALTLRLVGGLSTGRRSPPPLVPEATLAQRIVRAKRKIRDAGIPLSLPASLDERIAAVLGVLYLVFNEGYLSRGSGDDLVRVELTEEATRLTELVAELLPEHPEVEGLLALELYHKGRATRADRGRRAGAPRNQDRSRWDLSTIERANAVLHSAMSRGPAAAARRAGDHRRLPRQRPHGERHRLASDRRCVPPSAAARPVTGGRPEPRGGGGDGGRPPRRPGAARRDQGSRRLSPLPRGTGGAVGRAGQTSAATEAFERAVVLDEQPGRTPAPWPRSGSNQRRMYITRSMAKESSKLETLRSLPQPGFLERLPAAPCEQTSVLRWILRWHARSGRLGVRRRLIGHGHGVAEAVVERRPVTTGGLAGRSQKCRVSQRSACDVLTSSTVPPGPGRREPSSSGSAIGWT